MKPSRIMFMKTIDSSKCHDILQNGKKSGQSRKEILRFNRVYSVIAFFKLHACVTIGIE